jgi:hypothetical protein
MRRLALPCAAIAGLACAPASGPGALAPATTVGEASSEPEDPGWFEVAVVESDRGDEHIQHVRYGEAIWNGALPCIYRGAGAP